MSSGGGLNLGFRIEEGNPGGYPVGPWVWRDGQPSRPASAEEAAMWPWMEVAEAAVEFASHEGKDRYLALRDEISAAFRAAKEKQR